MSDPIHFVSAYLDTGCAKRASKIAGVELRPDLPTSGSYVYLLLCPDRSLVLYVGQGRGKRMHHHLRDVRNGRVTGAKKFKLLHRYVANGELPVAVVLKADISANEAFRLEKRIINRIGVERLGNTMPGQTSLNDKLLARLAWLRTQRKSFCLWLQEFNPAPDQIGSYAAHVAFLSDVEKQIKRDATN